MSSLNWTNADRAARGEDAVYAGSDYPADDLDTSIGDTLANLLHLCRREGIDFEAALARGREHFQEEVAEEEVTQ